MNIINCSPFNGNYLKTGSFGPACTSSSCGCGGCGCGSGGCGCGGCGCGGCGCGGCGCGGCGCGGCGCGGCGCECCCNHTFVPTPEAPFPCIQTCAAQNGSSACGCGSGAAQSCGCGSGCVYNSCADAVALLDHPCYGLSSIKNELDAVACTVSEIYNLMAPVPCNPCPCQSPCGC